APSALKVRFAPRTLPISTRARQIPLLFKGASAAVLVLLSRTIGDSVDLAWAPVWAPVWAGEWVGREWVDRTAMGLEIRREAVLDSVAVVVDPAAVADSVDRVDRVVQEAVLVVQAVQEADLAGRAVEAVSVDPEAADQERVVVPEDAVAGKGVRERGRSGM